MPDKLFLLIFVDLRELQTVKVGRKRNNQVLTISIHFVLKYKAFQSAKEWIRLLGETVNHLKPPETIRNAGTIRNHPRLSTREKIENTCGGVKVLVKFQTVYNLQI